MQTETCCSLPRTPAICSTDCTKHTHSECCCLPSGCESHQRVSYFSGTFSLTGFPTPSAYADGERGGTSIKSADWADLTGARGGDGTRKMEWQKSRKTRDVFGCLFLTDEGCPLLTLSGKIETGVEIVKPRRNDPSGCVLAVRKKRSLRISGQMKDSGI